MVWGIGSTLVYMYKYYEYSPSFNGRGEIRLYEVCTGRQTVRTRGLDVKIVPTCRLEKSVD